MLEIAFAKCSTNSMHITKNDNVRSIEMKPGALNKMHNAAAGLNSKWFIFIVVARMNLIVNAFSERFISQKLLGSNQKRNEETHSNSMYRGHFIKTLQYKYSQYSRELSVIYCCQKSRPSVVMKLKRHFIKLLLLTNDVIRIYSSHGIRSNDVLAFCSEIYEYFSINVSN